ncbi:Lrp/AsnC family transcriptional regulator [Actinospica durhamensis]|uniref:Lrp/AsnC family transcriptional regulator n=1 Tax=Actinospica durhamensis TaxID=1508375 RepID=A0A941EIA8_9ACTN|nr:Lrp/AsnC family transcriptional regulator [Actinospica durhamensis]MBR7831886.1 Lrp/AsnC family transcriptional regulator [Actinospica durhamensis]
MEDIRRAPAVGRLDLIDRQLLQALCVDGRAPLSRIAQALEVTARTATQHYRRLREAGGLRVLARADGLRTVEDTEWMVRLLTQPERAEALADEIAARKDVRWVALVSGGTEIACKVVAHGGLDAEALLGRRPAGGSIIRISAQALVSVYRRGVRGWSQISAALSPERIAVLAPAAFAPAPGAPRPGAPLRLDEADLEVIGWLGRDGRASYRQLAALTGRDESTVRRRVEALRSAGILEFDLYLDEAVLGHRAGAMLWMDADMALLPEIARRLSGDFGVCFAAATTGRTNLVAYVTYRDQDGLYESISRRIGTIPGVRRIEAAPIARTVKRFGAIG